MLIIFVQKVPLSAQSQQQMQLSAGQCSNATAHVAPTGSNVIRVPNANTGPNSVLRNILVQRALDQHLQLQQHQQQHVQQQQSLTERPEVETILLDDSRSNSPVSDGNAAAAAAATNDNAGTFRKKSGDAYFTLMRAVSTCHNRVASFDFLLET